MVEVDRESRPTKPFVTRRTVVFVVLFVLALAGLYTWRRGRTEALDERLFAAIARSDSAAVDSVLKQGADPNARQQAAGEPGGRRNFSGGIGIRSSGRPKGETALMAAVGKPPEIMRALLERGADPTLSGCEHGEWDALMHAARLGADESARLLLDKGASVDHHDQVGRCALSFAAAGGHVKMVKLLLEYNARPNVQDLSGMSPLLYALYEAPEKARVECMDLLLTYNAFPDQGMHGTTALMGAITHDRPDVVAVLLKHNASVNGMFMAGKSTLSVAREQGNQRIVQMLLKAGARDDGKLTTNAHK